MKNQIKSFYFLISLVLHVVVVTSLMMFSHDATFQKNFIVLGVHSQKPTKAFYKPTHYSPSPTPSSLKKSSPQKTSSASQRPQKQKKSHVKTTPVPSKKKGESLVTPQTKEKASLPHGHPELDSGSKPLSEKVTVMEEKKEIKKKQTQVSKKKKLNKQKQVKNKPQKKDTLVAHKQEKILPTLQPVVKQRELARVEKKEEVKDEALDKFDTTQTATVYLNQSDLEAELEQDEELEFTLGESSDIRLRGYYEHIQKEVSRLWRPPVGAPKGTECTLSFCVSKQGKVERFDIIKRSSMLIYDLSILRVAQQFSFDKCLWGKKFTIDFRQ